jgi:hypothetical protein
MGEAARRYEGYARQRIKITRQLHPHVGRDWQRAMVVVGDRWCGANNDGERMPVIRKRRDKRECGIR